MQLGTFTRNWRWQPAPPPPPEPEPLRLYQPAEPDHGNTQRGCFAAWWLYCHVTGRNHADEVRMRRWLGRQAGRAIESRKELTREEWRRCARLLEAMTRHDDGGLHEQLFGHCGPLLSRNRKLLLPGVYGALLGTSEPCEGLSGSSRSSWLLLLDRLQEHTHCGCPGGDDCSLLREARLLAESARRAA